MRHALLTAGVEIGIVDSGLLTNGQLAAPN